MHNKLAAVAICIAAFAMSAAAQTGTVPLFSGSTYSAPSTITELNGNVGIGTTSPWFGTKSNDNRTERLRTQVVGFTRATFVEKEYEHNA